MEIKLKDEAEAKAEDEEDKEEDDEDLWTAAGSPAPLTQRPTRLQLATY